MLKGMCKMSIASNRTNQIPRPLWIRPHIRVMLFAILVKIALILPFFGQKQQQISHFNGLDLVTPPLIIDQMPLRWCIICPTFWSDWSGSTSHQPTNAERLVIGWLPENVCAGLVGSSAPQNCPFCTIVYQKLCSPKLKKPIFTR